MQDILSYFNILNACTLLILLCAIILIKKYFKGIDFQTPNNIDLHNKYAIVTGGNSGIGQHTVKILANLGCSIIIGARCKLKAEKVIKKIREQNPLVKIQFIYLDLSSLQSIVNFVKLVHFESIDYLVNNAAVCAIPTRKQTKQGFQMQWGTNYLGHFYLTYLLWSKIKRSNYFKIINVSSFTHKLYLGFFWKIKFDIQNIQLHKNYDPQLAYSYSKLSLILFTRALSSKINNKNGLIVSLHPGIVRTDIMRYMLNESISGSILKVLLFIFWPIFCLFTKSPIQGAQTTLMTLLSNNIQNGHYYSECKEDKESDEVNSQNWNQLWRISQKKLGIQFKI